MSQCDVSVFTENDLPFYLSVVSEQLCPLNRSKSYTPPSILITIWFGEINGEDHSRHSLASDLHALHSFHMEAFMKANQVV